MQKFPKIKANKGQWSMAHWPLFINSLYSGKTTESKTILTVEDTKKAL
jgi:hypothetical protein